nr:acyl-CoA dehydrogenase family protein [Rhodococcus sp. HNM0569]
MSEVATGVFGRDLDTDGQWSAFVDAGLVAAALPESLGGDGLGVADVCSLLREVGRAAAPSPALATLGLAVLPLRHWQGRECDDAVHEILGEIAAGSIVTGALGEPGRPLPDTPETTARESGSGRVVVHGRVQAVPYGAEAARVLVPTDLGVAAVRTDDAALTLTTVANAAGTPEAAIALDGADGVLVARGTQALAEYAQLVTAAVASVADGLVAGATDLTAAHIRDRQQFGKPLATFQAVSQQIADAYVVARTLHLAAASAAWRLGEGLDATDDLDVAAYWLAAEMPQTMRTLHHLHGGLGVDVTYPLHRYSSTAKDLARLVGGADYRLDLLGERCSSN